MDNKHESKPADVRIVLVGKTGAGKSSAGNRILGVNAGSGFPVGSGFTSTTQECKRLTTTLSHGPGPLAQKTLAVVDTPGLCHSSIDRKQLIEEVLKCVTLVEPGPDVFLLVVDPSSFTEDDEEALNTFRRVFKGAESHTIVLFTHCHRNQDIDTFLKAESSKTISDFIKSTEPQAFNNEAEDQQVSELLEKIHRLVSNNGGEPYTKGWFDINKLFDDVKKSDSNLSVSRTELPGQLVQWCRGEVEKLCPPLKKFLETLEEATHGLMPASAKK